KDFSFYLSFIFKRIYKKVPEFINVLFYELLYKCNCKENFRKRCYELEVTIRKNSNYQYTSDESDFLSGGFHSPEIKEKYLNNFTPKEEIKTIYNSSKYDLEKELENFFIENHKCKKHGKRVLNYKCDLINNGIILIKINRI